MMCQRCQKAQATVHVDEVKTFFGVGHEGNVIDEHHLCETCASAAQLPGGASPHKTVDEIWHILQANAKAGAAGETKPQLECDECGLSLEQLRRKGRLGCQGCYETFQDYLGGLLERMHGSIEHVGRVPRVDETELERRRAIEEAQEQLDRAIESEEFERAAELRDRLQALDTTLDRQAGTEQSTGPDRQAGQDASSVDATSLDSGSMDLGPID